MRIHLYNPPVHHYSGVHYRLNPPLGLPILAAVLSNTGHKVNVTDLEALQITPEQLCQHYILHPEELPDAVGFTATSHSARGARESIQALRRMGYQGYIAVGGPHVTAMGAMGTLSDVASWGADAWVTDECEGNVVRIFEERLTGPIVGEQLPIADIPGPFWGAQRPQPAAYLGNEPKVGHPEGIAMWSRGCPHGCLFCANPVFGGQAIRYRPIEAIVKDMQTLKDLGCQSVFVYDDELVGHSRVQHEWLMRVCEAVAPLGLTWKCQGRCSRRLTPDVLRAMREAGCRAIMWGVESFSDSVLAAIHKGTKEEDIWHTLRLSHEAGIGNWLFLMVGNYEETAQDLYYTTTALDTACQEGLVQWRQVTVCTPVPGTELYRRAETEGWAVLPPEEGPQMAQVYNPTPWLTAREMNYWRARLQAVGGLAC